MNKLVSVVAYVTEVQKEVLDRAARLDNRSTSNFLLNLGLNRAYELGVARPFRAPEEASEADDPGEKFSVPSDLDK